jgi:hypothetical protein
VAENAKSNPIEKPKSRKKRKRKPTQRKPRKTGIQLIDTGAGALARWRGWRTRGPAGPVVVYRVDDGGDEAEATNPVS